MRIIGIIFMAVGLGILAFILYVLFVDKPSEIISPLPREQGVGIIVVTPTKTTR